ncbi:MAG: TlpA disulfide reductase family protein [Sedimenticola sp.]
MQRRDFILAMGAACLSPLASAGRKRGLVEPLTDGGTIPEFVLTDLQGRSHSPSDYRGRVLVVNFWATWCPPCRAEMPSMGRMLDKLKGSPVSLLAIAMGQKREQIARFAEEHPQPFPLLPDPGSKIAADFNVMGLPSTYITDRNGRLIYRVQGGREWDSPRMLRVIELLL